MQDARRHKVRVLPVDVTVSGWDSELEGEGSYAPVRLGLSLVRGMHADAAGRIEAARAVRPFVSVNDLANRAQLDRHDLQVLADANALEALAGNRRQALWSAIAAAPDRDLLRGTARDEDAPDLNAPSEGEDIIGDYRSTGLTLNRHPVALLRPQLLKTLLIPASALMRYRNGQLARACGIVTARQRPGTANGVMFMTLEDESGFVNVIVWESVLGKFRHEALSASLLAVYGVWQREGEVRHLTAQRLVDVSHMLGELTTVSRNFH